MFGKKKSKPSQSEAALMNDALSDLLHDQERKEKQRRRRGRLGLPSWVDRRILIALLVIFVGILADAVRRENQEFYATVTNLGGQVSARLEPGGAIQTVSENFKLADRSTIATGPGAWAELSFPDGSKVVMDGGSTMQIKLLEYQRGGRWRSRSFYLYSGRIFARIGENFGKKSQLQVFTPACVAAARGTRFSVAADGTAKAARTVVGDGLVEVRGFNGGRMNLNPNNSSETRAGSSPGVASLALAAEMTSFGHASLNEEIEPVPWYQELEMVLTQTLDGPLTILGIGKCSWAVGAADFARRTACQESLRKIRANLEGETSYPLWVDPATLAELNIKETGGVDMLLKSFDGSSIETYWSNGQRFIITARARDKARTRYELDQAVIRRSPNQN